MNCLPLEINRVDIIYEISVSNYCNVIICHTFDYIHKHFININESIHAYNIRVCSAFSKATHVFYLGTCYIYIVRILL